MFNDGKDGANASQQKPTRRAADKPHPFERNQGFRTCRACGLPRNHEVHDERYLAKYSIAEERPPQSIEELRERLRDNPPPSPPRFSLSHITLISGGVIVVVIGVVFLALFLFNNTVDEPLQRILKNPGNQIVRASAHVDGLDSSTLVFDLNEISGGASHLDVFRSFLQYAEIMKERHFTKVILACRGVKKFTLEGGYFQRLGQEYKRQNPVYIIRTFPPHLTTMDGAKPFSEYSSDLLDNVTKEVAQFTEFSDHWYARDSAPARSEADSSSAIAAEPVSTISPSSNDNWLVLDSSNEMDNTPEVSLHNAGTDGAVLMVHCANRKTEAYVDTDGTLENESVRVRFDDSAPVRQHWEKSGSDNALYTSDAIAFARRLMNSRIFQLEFTPFEKQGKTVVFDVSGLRSELQRVSNTCDIASIENYARTKSSPATAK